MNVKDIFKKIGYAIGGFFIALISFIIYGTINGRTSVRDNRKRADDIRKQTKTAGELNNAARNDVDKLEANLRDERQNIKECQSIISDVRSRGPKK